MRAKFWGPVWPATFSGLLPVAASKLARRLLRWYLRGGREWLVFVGGLYCSFVFVRFWLGHVCWAGRTDFFAVKASFWCDVSAAIGEDGRDDDGRG